MIMERRPPVPLKGELRSDLFFENEKAQKTKTVNYFLITLDIEKKWKSKVVIKFKIQKSL